MMFGSLDSIRLLHFPSICSPVRSAPTFGQTHAHSYTAHNQGWDEKEEEEEEDGDGVPHICHRRHGRRPCKFFLAGVNFYRFNANNWQFAVYFAVITQKIGNLLCNLS